MRNVKGAEVVRPSRRSAGFTLVELLVVIGIIAVLIAVLLPSLRQARLKGQQVTCMSNLKQTFGYMTIYCNSNKGYLFPVGPVTASSAPYASTLGTNVMPHERWPTILFEVKYKGLAYPNDRNVYLSTMPPASDIAGLATFMKTYDATPLTPRVMVCPSDIEPAEAHSYVVNQELVQNKNPVRFAAGNKGGRSSSDIIVAGEKRKPVRDYYMERPPETGGRATDPTKDPYGISYASDYDRVVEPYRHGLSYGSNFLFLDGHVATQLPDMAKGAVDPWDLPNTIPTPPNPPATP